jgi:hypothetical protein
MRSQVQQARQEADRAREHATSSEFELNALRNARQAPPLATATRPELESILVSAQRYNDAVTAAQMARDDARLRASAVRNGVERLRADI